MTEGRIMKVAQIAVGMVFLVLLLSPCAYAPEFSEKTDIIYMKDGKTHPKRDTTDVIRVIEETFESIVVDLKIGRITIPAADVDRIKHFDSPAQFNLGMGAIQSRSFEQAVAYFDKVKDASRPWVKMYTLFYRAEALREWGACEKQKNEEASKAYRRLRSSHPESIFMARAMLGDAVASIQMDKHEEARGKLEEIKNKLVTTKWETLADLWEGRLYEKEGNLRKAGDVYGKIAALTEYPEIKIEADLGEIRCLAKDERYGDALKRAEEFVKENKDPKVLGGAWNVIGDCHLARAEGNRDEIRRGLLAYLRVVVVYFFDPVSAARGAYKAGECFERLKQPNRAIDLYKRAVDTPGGGEWLEKAEERLKKIE